MPDTIIVRSQAEWDALPKKFERYTVIEIRSPQHEWITVRVLPESSSVVARESSSVVAWGSSSVEAWGSSSVVARGSSSVVARESSRVVAWGSSRVVARESSRVEAWESSRVVAWGQVSVHGRSTESPELHGQAVCFLYDGAGVPVRRSDNATVIHIQKPSGTAGWLEAEGVLETDGLVVLYKRVSKDFLTQEGTPNQTTWVVGEVKTHPAWDPTSGECGGGKFHACSRPYFCDEFRELRDDVYVAIQIKVADLYAWPNPSYQHKIAFREGAVLFQCDRFGDEIKTKVEVAA